MLYLYTGLPGSQKTANMLHFVLNKIEEKGKGSWSGRPVYFFNIKGMNHPEFQELTEEEARKWYELPEGSVILMDEAQKLFRPITRKDKEAPKEITELEEHRHSGYDILLTTQHPMLIHTAVRRQVQQHWHLERPFGMKTRALKWEKCINDPDDHFARKDAASESVKVPSSIFTYYRSTVMDTHKKRIPKKIYMIAALFLACIGGFFWLVPRIGGQSTDEPTPTAAEQALQNAGIPKAEPSKPAEGSFRPVYPIDTEEYLKLHEPRIKGKPATAPIYDELQKPVVAPRTLCYGYRKGGVDHCECVTQQMTPIAMPFAQCKAIVDKGMWDPTIKPATYNASGKLLNEDGITRAGGSRSG